MPIYLGLYHPKFNPFGEAFEITPDNLETEFTSYKFKVQAPYRLWAYQGKTPASHPVANPSLSLFYSEDGGWGWDRSDFVFPSSTDTRTGFVESTYMNQEIWYLVPVEGLYGGSTANIRLDLYRSNDFGQNWTLVHQFEETDWYFTGNPAGFRVFPCAKGVYVVGHMGNTIASPDESKIAVWKDGTKEDEWSVPNDSLFGGLISSFYNNYYEVGYFDLNRFPGSGGQHIYRFENGTITKINETPTTVDGDRPLFQNTFYIPRKDFLMITTQALTGARVYYSFDGGKELKELLGGIRMKAYNFVVLGRQKLIVDLSTGDTFRSDAYLEDLTPGYTWDDVLTGINAPDFDFAFPLRLSRINSEVVMWKLP